MSINSRASDVFYVEESSIDLIQSRPNTPIVLNSADMSGNDTREMISISSIATPGPHFVTIDSNSNAPTMPYRFGRQLPIISPSLNDLNLPQHAFKNLATMVVANPTGEGHDDNYSPHSPEPSEPSPISTLPMSVSSFNS